MESTLTTNVISEEGAAPSTLSVSGAESSPMLEEAGVAEALLIEDGARVLGPVGPLGTAAQPPVLTPGWPTLNFLFGLFLRRGDEEAALGCGDFLEGFEELKTLPFKDCRRHLKTKVFRVSFTVILFRLDLHLTSNFFLF